VRALHLLDVDVENIRAALNRAASDLYAIQFGNCYAAAATILK
jgi:hypothetical protein